MKKIIKKKKKKRKKPKNNSKYLELTTHCFFIRILFVRQEDKNNKVKNGQKSKNIL